MVVQPLALSKIDHVVGELFKYPVVPGGIRVSNIAELDVSTVLLDDSIEDSLRQKLNELTEKIFSAIHAGLCCFQDANLRNQFKSTRDIFAYN